MSAKLTVCNGGVRRTREELATLATPSPTETWRPIPHSGLVATLIGGLEARGIEIVKDEYATNGNGDARLFGTMDLRVPHLDDVPDYRLSLGLRASNDRKMAIRVIAGVKVFVCQNMCMSGGGVVLSKKHTRRLDLPAVIPSAIDEFLSQGEAYRADIDTMRGYALTDWRAKAIVYDAFAGGVLPIRLFSDVFDLYFRDDVQRSKFRDRSLWSVLQAFTEAVKVLKPAPQHDAGMRIGRYFSGLLHKRESVAIIDGLEVYEA